MNAQLYKEVLMKKFFVISLFLLILTGCSSSPTKPPKAQGVLKGEHQANIQFQKTPALTSVSFNTTGYTVFGAIYVAAAVEKMHEHTKEMKAAYANYLSQHPEIQSLQDTFNNELKTALMQHGVKVKVISADKIVNDNKEVSYRIHPEELNANKAIVLDGLFAQYFAPSSTDDYNPRTGIMISVMDGEGKSTKPIEKQEIDVTIPKSYAYSDYESLKKDVGKAYDGLQKSAKLLAQKVADTLLELDKAASMSS